MIEMMLLQSFMGSGSSSGGTSDNMGQNGDTQSQETSDSTGAGGFDQINIDQIFDLINSINCGSSAWNKTKATAFISQKQQELQAAVTNFQTYINHDNFKDINEFIKSYKESYAQPQAWLISKVNPARACSKVTLEAMCPALDGLLASTLSKLILSLREKKVYLKLMPDSYIYNGIQGHDYDLPSYKVVKGTPVALADKVEETIFGSNLGKGIMSILGLWGGYELYKKYSSNPNQIKFKSNSKSALKLKR